MRILHPGIFNIGRVAEKYYCTDRKISHGLVRLGHFVYEYSYRDMARYLSPIRSKRFGVSRMNKHFIDTIEYLQPDLLLLGHFELINTITLDHIKNNYPNLKIAMWYVDPLYITGDYINKLEYLDVFFATTAGHQLEALKSHTNAKILFMPNICDASVDSFRGFDNPEPKIDLSFIGGASHSSHERNILVLKLKDIFKDINFKMYGHTRKKRVLGKKYFETIYNSKLCLSLNRIDNQPMYTSDRLVHITANGSTAISPEVPDLRRLFDDNEIVYYQNTADLIEKVHYYLKNPEARLQIAKAGHSKSHRAYNSTRVCEYFLEAIFDNNYSEPYEWLI